MAQTQLVVARFKPSHLNGEKKKEKKGSRCPDTEEQARRKSLDNTGCPEAVSLAGRVAGGARTAEAPGFLQLPDLGCGWSGPGRVARRMQTPQ